MNKRKIRWTLVVAWMILIFIFSNMPGDVSDEKSKFVIYIFNMLGLNLNSIFGSLADFIVRKCAHFTEYFIFFMLVFNAIKYEVKSFYKALILSILAVFLYACTDEFHQSFIPGRGPSFRDVMIDTSGGALALVITFVIKKLKKEKH